MGKKRFFSNWSQNNVLSFEMLILSELRLKNDFFIEITKYRLLGEKFILGKSYPKNNFYCSDHQKNNTTKPANKLILSELCLNTDIFIAITKKRQFDKNVYIKHVMAQKRFFENVLKINIFSLKYWYYASYCEKTSFSWWSQKNVILLENFILYLRVMV